MNKEGFSISEIQNWMQHIILQRGAISASNDAELPTVKEIVNSSYRLSAERHINIYQGSYIARLRECMRNQFSALAYALGTGLFEAFTDQYLDTHPSHSYTLNDLGGNFTAFLENTRPDAGQEVKESWPDFMIELAGFEYALSLIFDEYSNENPGTATEDCPDETLHLSPVFHLFHHRYPICKYYLDFTQKKEPELPFPEESFCAVTRINYRLGLFVIQPAQFHFLSKLKAGATIPSAKDELSKQFQFDRAAVENVWKEWRKYFIASGFLVRK